MNECHGKILYCAPGSGVGHIVRACSVSLRLAEAGIESAIVTNSPFADGMARMTGCEIISVQSESLAEGIRDIVANIAPPLIVLDSFPFGLRGEWADSDYGGTQFVYMARRLKVKEYVQSVGIEWEPRAAQLKRIIVTEPLSNEHEALLKKASGEIHKLSGRIRFPHDKIETPAPVELEKLLDGGRLWLVVHSGTWSETKRLVDAAKEDMRKSGGGEIAGIFPVAHAQDRFPCFEYFPAAKLFPRVHCLVSGAGYNVMAEAAAAGCRHIAVPFRRMYDDQRARIFGPPAGTADGSREAASILARMLGQAVR